MTKNSTFLGETFGLIESLITSSSEERDQFRLSASILKRGFLPGDMLKIVDNMGSSKNGFDSRQNLDSYGLLIKEEFFPCTWLGSPAKAILLTLLVEGRSVTYIHKIQVGKPTKLGLVFESVFGMERLDKMQLRLEALSAFEVVSLV